MRAERMKRSTMTMPVQQQANTEDTAVTRTELVHLLQEAGRPEPLDVSGQDVRGITLINCNLEGANLSQARVCEAKRTCAGPGFPMPICTEPTCTGRICAGLTCAGPISLRLTCARLP